MLKRFRDLKVATKLFLVVLTMAFPIVATIVIFVRDSNALTATVRNEIRGLDHLHPVDQLLDRVNRHRDLTVAVLNGAKETAKLVEEVTPLVDQDFATLETLIASQNDVYEVNPAVADLKRRWQAVRAKGFDVSADESFTKYTELSDGIQGLLRTFNDRSELILDPVIASYYLMDIAVLQVPDVMENLSLLRAYNIKAHLRPLSIVERAAALGEVERLKRDFVPIRRDLAVASGADATLASLQSVEKAAVQAAELFFGQFAAEAEKAEAARAAAARGTAAWTRGTAAAAEPPIPATASKQTVEEAFQEGERAIGAFLKLQAATQVQLERLLTAREASLRISLYQKIGFGVLCLLLAAGLSFWVVRSITTPVKSMMSLFGALGMGNFKARAQVKSADELGTLANSLNAMLDNMTDLMLSRDDRDQMQISIQKLLEEVSGVTEGDLTRDAEVSVDMTGAIADAFNQMIGELRKIIGDVQGAATRVTMSAQQLQHTTHQLAEGSESQAAQIVGTSAAVEEMAASINQVSANAASSATVAEQARANAEQGTRAVTRTIEGMGAIRDQVQETAKRIKRLGESSQEIGEIVQLIGDIADRTSILALNASIQAAMAGEAGRGFAVVAEEVERLADRATDATKRISTLIKTTQSETAEAVVAMEDTTREVVNGSALANEAGVALSEIQNVSNRLAQLIQAISDASQQQAKGSEQVAKAMSDISINTRNTASGTKDTAESIGSLATLANTLNVSMARFKLPSSQGREKAA